MLLRFLTLLLLSLVGGLQCGMPRLHSRATLVQSSKARKARFQPVMEASSILMPALSSTMTEGKISQWLVGVGDKVEAGDMVLVVESDKADMDVETYEEGFIAQILVQEGESAAVGAAVAVVVETEDEIEGTQGGVTPIVAATPVPAAVPSSAAAPSDVDVIEVFMPALSSTMKEGKISQWLVNIGDKVEAGDMLLVVESDKADMDVETYEDGYLAAILTGEGEVAAVGAPVALLAKSADEIEKVAAAGPAGSATSVAAAPAVAAPEATPSPAAPAPMAAPAATAEGRILVSPFAKTLAESKGIDLSLLVGSGPGGRIMAEDVEAAASGTPVSVAPAAAAAPPAFVSSLGVVATPAAKKLAKTKGIKLETIKGTGNFGRITPDDVLIAAGEAPSKASPPPAPAPSAAAPVKAAPAPAIATAPAGVVPMNAMQKAVVNNMAWANDVPTYTVSRGIVTDELDALYKKVKEKGVTMSALLAKAVGVTLAKHPIMNAAYVQDGIKYNSDVNVAMAVAMPDGGLITPVLKQADKEDLYSLGRSWKDLVKRAFDKKLSPDEFTTGTFTVSNLGMFGVSSFVSILPPNTGAIMAVAASTPTAVLQKNGMMGMVKMMTVTVTCDHRHIYGADAAKFLQDLADIIENDTQSLLL